MFDLPSEYLFWLAISALVLNMAQLGLYYKCVQRLRIARQRAHHLDAKLAHAEQANPPQPNGAAEEKPRAHPIWAVVHVGALVGGLFLVLQSTASHFDSTEVLSILWFLLVAILATQLGPDAFNLFVKGN